MPGVSSEVRLEQLKADVEAHGPEAVKLFKQIMAKGETAEWAAMCACQQAPGSKGTDRAFGEGARRQMERMDPENRRLILERAKKAGIKTDGKFYKGGLGAADNPLAWVSTNDDVIASCKAQKLNCTGVVNVKSFDEGDIAPVKPKRLSEDIVHAEAQRLLRLEPKTREKVRKSTSAYRELQERVIDTHGRPSSFRDVGAQVPRKGSQGTRKAGRKRASP